MCYNTVNEYTVYLFLGCFMSYKEFKKISCCFGHRKIVITNNLINDLTSVVEKLIKDNQVDTFLFGSKSEFNDLCHSVVTELKQKYPHIKRVYVRAEFPQIDESYKAYLLESYEDTYYSQNAIGAGKAVYIERNRDMIDKSHFCIIYYNETCSPKNRKSGTQIALNYAVKRKKNIIVLPSQQNTKS